MAATAWGVTTAILTTETTDVWQQTATETATGTEGAVAAILQLYQLKQQPKPLNFSLIFHLYKLYNKRLSCFTSLFEFKGDEIIIKNKQQLKSNTLIEAKVRLQTAGQLLITLLTLIELFGDFGCLWWWIVVTFKKVFMDFHEMIRIYMNMK